MSDELNPFADPTSGLVFRLPMQPARETHLAHEGAATSPVSIACPVCEESEAVPEKPSVDAFMAQAQAFLERHAHAEGQLRVGGVPVVRPPAMAVLRTSID